jgi:hypothetical protein
MGTVGDRGREKNGWGSWHPEVAKTHMVGSGPPSSPSPVKIADKGKN